jgi:hypothetical protein
VGRFAASSKLILDCWTKAPPPRAITLSEPPRNPWSNSFKASCSTRRNSASPPLRKISATVRFSRCWIRSSRSSNVQSKHSAKTRPTVLFPAPINPTRITACICGGRVLVISGPRPDKSTPAIWPTSQDAALGYSVFYWLSARFLRWILPLKVRNTTVDETATRPTVPAKARPLSSGK